MNAASEMRADQITVRQVHPSAEREQILAVLHRNLPTAAAPERFDWLYLSNPDGPALVWLAEDADGMPLGTSAAHPRRMRIDGCIVRAINLGDFAVDPAYRTLGPALQLLRATLTPVCDGSYAFSYDHPSRAMHALYQRMGLAGLGRAERWVLPLTLWNVFRGQLGQTVSGVIGAAADLALRARAALHPAKPSVQVETLAGACGPEFDALDAQLAGSQPVMGVRDAAYLNWRYLQHTMWRHVIICARRNERLVGYAVLRPTESQRFSLMDLRAEDDDGVRHALIGEAARWAQYRGAQTLDVEVLGDSDSAHMVRSLGFVAREEHIGPVCVSPIGGPYAAQLVNARSWWLMGGDRDI